MNHHNRTDLNTMSSNSFPAIEQSLAQQVETFATRNQKSRAAIESSSAVLPSGTSRAVLVHQPFPLVLQGGSGCHVTSLDGDEYLDFVSEYCAGMFGHSHPEIISAIQSVTQTGFMLGGPTCKEQELARLLVSRFPSMDAVRFCNSGTEANTLALATALAYTGRKKVRRHLSYYKKVPSNKTAIDSRF